ncbi:signal peptidase II [Patescibacteria group bacterium]
MKKVLTLKTVGFFLLAAIVILFLDRTVKELILQYFTSDIEIIPNFFKITSQQNTGVAFGIQLPYVLQLVLFPILLIFGFYVVTTQLDFNKLSVQIISGCIAGAALSNFIDRVIYQHVVDYIAVSIYPVFNIADAFITVGIFLLVVFYGKIKKV